jgi:hypothetical protein
MAKLFITLCCLFFYFSSLAQKVKTQNFGIFKSSNSDCNGIISIRLMPISVSKVIGLEKKLTSDSNNLFVKSLFPKNFGFKTNFIRNETKNYFLKKQKI